MNRRFLLAFCIVFFGTALSFLFAKPTDAQAGSALIATPAPPPSPTSSTTFKNGSIISISGTAASGSFVSYQVEWAAGLDAGSGWQSTGITLAGGGLLPVSNGLLANWDTSSITASGYYTVRLILNSSNLAPQQALTMVYLEPDLLSTNWPQFLSQGPALGAGVVPARNADGTFRLLLEAPKGPSPIGVSELWTFSLNGTPQQTQQPGAGGFMQPSVANFDGGTAEQAMVIDFSDLDFFNENSSLSVLNTNPNIWYVGSQTVVEDLAGDNAWKTLGYGFDYKTQVAYLSAWQLDGTQVNSNFPIQLASNNPGDGNLNRNPVLVGDINGDGKKEIVAMKDLSPTTFTLALFGNDGSPLTWNVPALAGTLGAMVAADLDNNGKLETVVSANTETQTFLHIFQPDGTERSGWPLTFANSGISSQSYLAIGDLNRDGTKEIVYAQAGFLYVLKGDGTSFSSAWPLNAGTGPGSAFGYNAVTIGDVDGDGFPEILTVLNKLDNTADPFFTTRSFGNEQLLAIRRDGTISRSWQLTAGYGCFTQFYPAPSIGDFNQDGITDIAVAYDVSGSACASNVSAGIVTILSTGAPYNPALNDWPLVRHDPRNTSVLPSSSTVVIPDFTLSIGSAQPVDAGSSAVFTVTVVPSPSPYDFPVGSFGCTNLPKGASCLFKPGSVIPGASSATTTLTIATMSRTLAAMTPAGGSARNSLQAWAAMGFSIVGIFGLIGTRNQKKPVLQKSVQLAVLLIASASWYGCAGSSSGNSEPMPNPNGTPAGTYEITVTAVGNGATAHSAIVTLRVN